MERYYAEGVRKCIKVVHECLAEISKDIEKLGNKGGHFNEDK